MTKTLIKNKIQVPNMLLIAGNGRNVGKTTLACRIIAHLSRQTEVTGIKISSHFHEYAKKPLIEVKGKFVILQEKEHTQKDSSLMLQAGASKVFFVMAKREYLHEAFLALNPLLGNNAVVCESGGLNEIVEPGLFLFVNEKDRPVEKYWHLETNPVPVQNNGTDFDMKIESISFGDHQIKRSE